MRKSSGDAEAGGKQWKTSGRSGRRVEAGGRPGRGRKGSGRFGRGAGGSEEVRKAVGKCGRGGKGTGSNGTLQQPMSEQHPKFCPNLFSLFWPQFSDFRRHLYISCLKMDQNTRNVAMLLPKKNSPHPLTKSRTPDQGFPTFWAYFVRFLTKHFSKISQNVSESGSTCSVIIRGPTTNRRRKRLLPNLTEIVGWYKQTNPILDNSVFL